MTAVPMMRPPDHRHRCLAIVWVVLGGIGPMGIWAQTAPPDDPLLRDLPSTKRAGAAEAGRRGGIRKGPAASSGDASARPAVDADDEAWESIARWAAQAARELAAGETGESTQQVQQRILARLESMASRRSAQADSEANGRRSRGPRSARQAASTPQGAAKKPLQPGSGSAESGGSRADPRRVADHVWGHLPPAVQRRLRALGSVRFLPQYEKQIEAYYQRLAE